MQLSNRILASFIIVFIISILFGTQLALREIDRLTGAGLVERGNVSVTIANICGDGNIFGSESCDTTAPSNTTCVTRSYDAGTLACYTNCSFDTSKCTNEAAAAAAAAGGESPAIGGIAPTPIIYNPDIADTFDFAIGKVRAIFIKFNGENFAVNVVDLGHSAVLKIVNDDLTKTHIIHFELGQTKPVDLDSDGNLDLTFTLTDVLTRRAVFHIEKLKAQQQQQQPQQPRTETPRFEDYSEYYSDAFLLLSMVILAILNFAIFKKFITSKK